MLADILSHATEENLRTWLEQYREFGPLPALLLGFLKSFVPPLPTLLVVGVNAAVYGLWLGFLYSLTGIVAGCVLSFALVRRITAHPIIDRWARKPKVLRTAAWMRRNAFGAVFLLSLFPLGPFVVINVAAALTGMRLRSFLLALVPGKAIMVFTVSLIGYDVSRFLDRPYELLYVAVFIGGTYWVGRRIEIRFTRDALKKEAAGR